MLKCWGPASNNGHQMSDSGMVAEGVTRLPYEEGTTARKSSTSSLSLAAIVGLMLKHATTTATARHEARPSRQLRGPDMSGTRCPYCIPRHESDCQQTPERASRGSPGCRAINLALAEGHASGNAPTHLPSNTFKLCGFRMCIKLSASNRSGVMSPGHPLDLQPLQCP